MTDLKPLSGSVSLDDLLKANKEQFDRIFTTQMEGGSARPEQPRTGPSGPRNATAELNAQFGKAWSSEVVEHKKERGRVTVLCRLTVDGTSKMQFGSARANGDDGAALQRATDEALLKCAAMFGTQAETEAKSEHAPPAKPVRGRASTALMLPAPSEAQPVRLQPSARRGGLPPGRLDVALRNVRDEMDATLARSAMAPAVRDGHGQASLIADARGRMLVGRFGAPIGDILDKRELVLEPGDVLLVNDPYACGGASADLCEAVMLMAVFAGEEPVGFVAMRAELPDVGGPIAGSAPAGAESLFGEGLRIPLLRLFERGELNRTALDLLLGNLREPDAVRSDLLALADACQVGARRIQELCQRFGRERYVEACEALLAASNRAMRRLIAANLSEEPHAFEDMIDDDGRGNGPFKLKLTVWREGEEAFFDWTGTAAQAPGPVNFFLNESLFKTVVGIYLLSRAGGGIALNEGFHDLINVTMPEASLMQPAFPAALGQNRHTQARHLDVLAGALAHGAPDKAAAAGYGSRPVMVFSGIGADGQPFRMQDTLLGGLPGRPAGDGPDGHSLWPHEDATPAEYLERHFPVEIERRAAIPGSGGAGRHRGGNGVETVYRFLRDGTVSLQNDRQRSRPWGLRGGRPGSNSEHWLDRKEVARESLPAKADGIRVRSGDRIVVRTAGGGGWGDPLQRDPQRVRQDVQRGLIDGTAARETYGVVLHGDRLSLDAGATEDVRESMRRGRRTPPLFDFGGRRDGSS